MLSPRKNRVSPDTDSGGGDVNTTTDEQRFTELYRQHYADISTYVRRRIDADQVTDIVAEVFATAWRRLDEIPAERFCPGCTAWPAARSPTRTARTADASTSWKRWAGSPRITSVITPRPWSNAIRSRVPSRP